MAGEYNRFTKQAQLSTGQLSDPRMQREAELQNLDPANMQELQQALRDPRHRGRMQQQVLGDELKRIQGLQTRMIQEHAQRMPQQLQQSLSPAKTGEPWPSPESMMIRLMLKLRGGPAQSPGSYSNPALPGVSGAPMDNPYPSAPHPPIRNLSGGVRG
jgi:hypothetical protein